MERIYTCEYDLATLRRLIGRGLFAVPELQREFVWNGRKACDLLDSVYRHYPIGTILVWKTSRRNESQLRKHLHILPPFNPTNREILFLIDGQQRLSVLWHLLRGEPGSVVNSERQRVDFGKVYFDTAATDNEQLFLYRARVPRDLAKRLVPVVDLFSKPWRQRLKHHGPRALKRAERCRRSVLAFRTHFVICETSDLSEVRYTFVRINSGGTRISAADRAFARASSLDLRNLVRDAQSRMEHGFDRVSRETILQIVALALGHRALGEQAIQAMTRRLEASGEERSRFERIWPRMREALLQAADYMVHSLRVPNFGFLPSEPMVIPLALFFFHNDNSRPSRAAKQRLERWFWATAVGARYTGRGYRPNLLADVDFVERLARNPRTPASFRVAVPLHLLKSTEYGRPGPLSNAFFCLLRLRRPRFLEDGDEIPLGAISTRRDRSDKHHIFPRALLTRHGFAPERYNSLLNICFLVARENQSVGRRAPSDYFDHVPRSKRARTQTLRSHLIPNTPGVGIWDRSIKRGFRSFLDQRARLVAQQFERQAGMRLFERR